MLQRLHDVGWHESLPFFGVYGLHTKRCCSDYNQHAMPNAMAGGVPSLLTRDDDGVPIKYLVFMQSASPNKVLGPKVLSLFQLHEGKATRRHLCMHAGPGRGAWLC